MSNTKSNRKFRVLEHADGTFTVCNSTKSKHWESTRSDDLESVERLALVWNAKHEAQKAAALVQELIDLGTSDQDNMFDLFEVGHPLSNAVDAITAANEEHNMMDPSGWKA